MRKLWITFFGRPPESIARKVGKDRSRRPVSRTIPCSTLPSAFASFAQRFGKSGLSWTSRSGSSGLASARFVPSDPIPDPRIEVPLGGLGAVRLEAASSAADGRAWQSMTAQLHPLLGLRKLWSVRTIFAPTMLFYRDFTKYGMADSDLPVGT